MQLAERPGSPRRKAHFLHVLLEDRIEVAEVHHCVHDGPIAADVSQSWKAPRASRAAFAGAGSAIVSRLKLFLIRHLAALSDAAIARSASSSWPFQSCCCRRRSHSRDFAVMARAQECPSRGLASTSCSICIALHYNDAYRGYCNNEKKKSSTNAQRQSKSKSNRNPVTKLDSIACDQRLGGPGLASSIFLEHESRRTPTTLQTRSINYQARQRIREGPALSHIS